ncbi:MAG: hypothetical protein ACM3IJ_05185 [Candidatus Levyibacteriota bacterium]
MKAKSKKLKRSRYSSGPLPYLLAGFFASVLLFTFIHLQSDSSEFRVLGSSTLAENTDHQQNIQSEDRQGPEHEDSRPSMPERREGVQPPPPRGATPPEPEDRKPESEKDDDIHLKDATGSSGFLLWHRGVQAESEDKLEHDPESTHSVLLTTPSGHEHILVLPDQAVKAVLDHNELTTVPGADASGGAKLKLLNKDNKPVFEVQGSKAKKFLGLIPVTIPKTVDVSATDGSIVNTTQSFFSKLLDLLSS